VSNVEVVGAQVDLPNVAGSGTQSTGLETMKTVDRLVNDLSVVQDIAVRVSVVLGTTDLPVRQLLKLGRGAVVELNRRVGDPVDIYINDRLVARGEMIRLGDKLGVTMTEICKSD
jgi:flagellar motor switch protein FliN/FliY